MSLLAFGLANVVQKGSGQQARACSNAVDGSLPSGGQEAVVELKSQGGDPLGMRKIGIEAVRPKLHTASGEGLNLFALRQRGAPDLPERIGANHLLAVTIDPFRALGENS